jgi:hypothetical protein
VARFVEKVRTWTLKMTSVAMWWGYEAGRMGLKRNRKREERANQGLEHGRGGEAPRRTWTLRMTSVWMWWGYEAVGVLEEFYIDVVGMSPGGEGWRDMRIQAEKDREIKSGTEARGWIFVLMWWGHETANQGLRI